MSGKSCSQMNLSILTLCTRNGTSSVSTSCKIKRSVMLIRVLKTHNIAHYRHCCMAVV
ncbi:hypothetical protein [Moraxella lacunata]|uniref:hypothetical protein n=1 Tax=Moraxella lacunata TaxID=477 RepID=UPI003EDEA0B4